MGNKLTKVKPVDKTKVLLVKPPDSWDQKMKPVKEAGNRMAKKLREQGHPFDVAILAPKEVRSGDSVPLSGIMMELDWKIATKWEMVESARDLITNAYNLDSLDPALPTILTAVIEGRGLYEYGIGEFFLLYGKFEQKHQTTGQQTRTKMEALVKGDQRYLKPYTICGKVHCVPLPYAVRNILGHVGTNPNVLDKEGKDLRTSIDLLKSWVDPSLEK